MAFRHNISGDTTIALASPGDNMSRIKSIVITNTHASSSMTVNLYIGGLSIAGVAATYYYLLKGKLIHKGESLILENDSLKFDNAIKPDEETNTADLGLYIQLGSSTSTADVIIGQ